jgi:hypothetical protein
MRMADENRLASSKHVRQHTEQGRPDKPEAEEAADHTVLGAVLRSHSWHLFPRIIRDPSKLKGRLSLPIPRSCRSPNLGAAVTEPECSLRDPESATKQ